MSQENESVGSSLAMCLPLQDHPYRAIDQKEITSSCTAFYLPYSYQENQ